MRSVSWAIIARCVSVDLIISCKYIVSYYNAIYHLLY